MENKQLDKRDRKIMGNINEIDSWMENIFLKVIKKEYDNGRIIEESNLHSTVYFHLRKLIESSRNKKLFVYSEMPFSTTMKDKRKKYPRVDLAVVIWEKEAPKDLLAVIELKHYDIHYNSIGVNKDLEHLKALWKGIYYPYADSPTKLKAKRAYFLYLVDKGEISFDPILDRKLKLLKKTAILKSLRAIG